MIKYHSGCSGRVEDGVAERTVDIARIWGGPGWFGLDCWALSAYFKLWEKFR